MDKWLRNNNIVKIIAFLLAVALWYVVNGPSMPNQPYKRTEETYRITEVALTPKYDQEHYQIVKIPKTVSIELRGTASALSRDISPSDYQVYVDLTQVGKGTHMVPVIATGFPSDISVQVIPSKVEVTLEEKQKVEKEVSVKLTGTPANGYTTGNAIIKPQKVHVTLPNSMANDVSQVQATVNVAGQQEGIDQTVPLKVLDKQGDPLNVEINPAVVEVIVPVTAPYKTVPIKMSYTNNPPDSISINSTQVKPEKVTVYGPKQIIDKMEYYPGPEIDLSSIKQNSYMQLKLPLAPGVVKVDPDFIEVEVNVTQTAKRTFDNIPITMNGLGQGLKAVVTKPDKGVLTLNVQGTSDKLNSLKPEDIQVYVDLSNLPAGEQDVPIQLNLPPFVTTVEDPKSLHAVVKIDKAVKSG